MFDKQAVDDYRRTTAPDTLKPRVINAASIARPASLRLLPTMSSLAACLAVIAAALTLWLSAPSPATISTDGVLLTNDAQVLTASAVSRTQAEHYAVLTLQADGAITVETADTFLIQSEEGDWHTLSSPHRTSNTLTLRWCVINTEAHITVNGVSYTLYADLQKDTVSVTKSI